MANFESCEKATDLILSLCPYNVFKLIPFSTSQIIAVLSRDPVITYLESCEKATDETLSK